MIYSSINYFQLFKFSKLARLLLLFSLVLLLACPADNETRYVGLEGRIVISGDAQLSNIWIGATTYNSILTLYSQIWDSTRTDSNGLYYLAKAVPELWENTTGCSASPTYFVMSSFALWIAPENRDTAFVLFYPDSSDYDPDRLSITPTQVFIGEHHLGGEPGNVREAPVITLEY